jgi:peptidoglycan hydrolase CwlO-like protein
MRNQVFKLIFLSVAVIFAFLLFRSSPALAVTASDCLNKSPQELTTGEMNECIEKILPQIASAYAPAQQKNKEDLANLNKQLSDLSARITKFSAQLKSLGDQIIKREKDLAFAQVILDEKAVGQYIDSRLYDPVWSVISAPSASEAFKLIKLRELIADEDRKTIENYASDLSKLKSDKGSLEKNKASLSSLQLQVSEKQKFLAGEVAKVDSYLSSLSTKQNELLALKSGSFSVSVGDAALADDYNASFAGWQANAPGGSVTVFSFGAYAGNGSNYRRNGMSQYGAWNRAKSGQDANAILQAYYNATPIHISSPETISTDAGTMPFEKQYLYGIAEMPSSWTDNNSAALKAQAIAARTFAIRSSKPICTSDKCQVYRASKVNDPSAKAWRDAVDATEGMVLPDGVSAQYVSTPGGYLDTKGWDTVCGSQGCLASNAWDGSSPWFYKAWYTNYKYPSGFSSCKRSNPWLSQTDISDILNAWKVYNNGSDEDKSRILPPDGCGGGSPLSTDEMRSRADSLGGGYSSVSSVNVQQSTSGYTSSITFQTNNGSVSITGFDTGCSHKEKGCKDFWTIFNLRAPGNISIKNRMFDIKVK